MRNDRDMLEAIQKIEQHAHDESFIARDDELVEVWVIHHLQIIGETASRVSPELQEKHPEVAWGGMIGMRHVLVHGYFETDTGLVKKVVERDLPILKTQLETILTTLK